MVINAPKKRYFRNVPRPTPPPQKKTRQLTADEAHERRIVLRQVEHAGNLELLEIDAYHLAEISGGADFIFVRREVRILASYEAASEASQVGIILREIYHVVCRVDDALRAKYGSAVDCATWAICGVVVLPFGVARTVLLSVIEPV
jgi:hypothetical protein